MIGDKFNVRIEKINIKSFKNVKNGTIDFAKTIDDDFSFSPSILGLYGQNGSGKTTLIQVVEIIKILIMGKSLPKDIIDIVSIDSNACEIVVSFVITDNKTKKYNVIYDVCLSVIQEKIDNTVNHLINSVGEKKIVLTKEKLSSSFIDLENKDNCIKTNPIICCEMTSEKLFSPSTKIASLTNGSKIAQQNLLFSKKISYDKSKSFIFSVETLKEFRENSSDDFSMNVIESLVHFANANLFVIGTKNSALINLNAALPFNFKLTNKNVSAIGNIAIDLMGTSSIPTEAFEIVNASIISMNTVLEKLIPGLKITLEEIGKQNDINGNETVQVQLYSIRNGKKVSMKNESEGIKKIVSILQLLIVMFNNPSTTVAIDELDSGIFEYLLGELLRIISKQAKGQLIFTSHNLRALETIDKKYVYFTTTNEDNRYIKMSYVSTNNNLRDFYFHELLLGGQKEELYEQTNNGAISLAFKKAGESVGK